MLATKTRIGWIGIDPGNALIKAVQLQEDHGQWSLSRRVALPRETGTGDGMRSDRAAELSLAELETIQSLCPELQGHAVAAMLPMSCCELHPIQRTLEEDQESRDIVKDSVATTTQFDVADLQFDYWTVEAAPAAPSTQWTTAIAAPSQITDQLSETLLRARLQCKTIDALPFALARAVKMVTEEENERPVAILDWGHQRATLCIVYAGRPYYVRCLKRCGFGQVIQLLRKKFQLSHLEAQTLIEQHGLPLPGSTKGQTNLSLLGDLLTDQLNHFVNETTKTLEHYQYQRRTKRPATLYLAGGGGTIRNITPHLSSSLKMHVKLWQLSPYGNNTNATEEYPECLFATAAALSLLAWEAV